MDIGVIGRLISDRVPADSVHFEADSYLFHQGEPADRLLVVCRGRVALEVLVPGRGPLIVDTMREGELLGVSWLFPPYRWQFDARAVQPIEALCFDAARLRVACEQDSLLGYQLMRVVAGTVLRRLQSARLRQIDLYGHASTG